MFYILKQTAVGLKMKSSQYKAGAHLSDVTSEERRVILNSSHPEMGERRGSARCVESDLLRI